MKRLSLIVVLFLTACSSIPVYMPYEESSNSFHLTLNQIWDAKEYCTDLKIKEVCVDPKQQGLCKDLKSVMFHYMHVQQ
jgi:hypothetical protein